VLCPFCNSSKLPLADDPTLLSAAGFCAVEGFGFADDALGFSVVHLGAGGFAGLLQPNNEIIATSVQMRKDIYSLLSNVLT
jgi:hypothetical protein